MDSHQIHRGLSVEQRITLQTRRTESGCIVWTRTLNRGYAKIRVGGRKVYAHRYAYEQKYGPIPKGLELDHLCRTPACINADHLEPVSHPVNMGRGYWAQKTHCANGHLFNKTNTRYRKEGGRACRSCARIRTAKRRALYGRY